VDDSGEGAGGVGGGSSVDSDEVQYGHVMGRPGTKAARIELRGDVTGSRGGLMCASTSGGM
jgi:hypothetical protein